MTWGVCQYCGDKGFHICAPDVCAACYAATEAWMEYLRRQARFNNAETDLLHASTLAFNLEAILFAGLRSC